MTRGEEIAGMIAVDSSTAGVGAKLIDAAVAEARSEGTALLLSLIGSLTLCDHMGDVSNDVADVLKQLAINDSWDDWPELRRILARRGVRTQYGTELCGPEDEEPPA